MEVAERGPPACSQPHALLRARSPAADQIPPPARAGVEAAPQRRAAPGQPRRASVTCGEPAARLEAAPAAVLLQPLPGERTPTPHDTGSRCSARSGSSGRDPTGSRREPLAQLSRGRLPEAPAPRTEILPNMEPAHGAGGGRSARRARRTGGSREKRDATGEPRQELSGNCASREPRVGEPPHGPRAPPSGRTGECLAPWRKATVDSVGGKRAKRPLNPEPPAHCSRQFPRNTCESRQALSRKLLHSHLLKDMWLTSGC